MNRVPDYSYGRFFFSPLLACSARCSFCYIFQKGYTGAPRKNEFGLAQSLQWLIEHPNFSKGRSGSVISIGAWGDPFPRSSNEDLQIESVNWLRALSEFGNPVQIMSRFSIEDKILDAIADCQQFDEQILFSTSISSLTRWKDFEKGADPPAERLKVLSKLGQRGVRTNVMIKPFLPGITDLEAEAIATAICASKVEYCVVGSFHWNEAILSALKQSDVAGSREIVELAQAESHKQLLDCSSTDSLHSFATDTLQDFIGILKSHGLKVFMKSACVNSHLLQEKNAVLIYSNDTEALCVKCGVCESTSSSVEEL